MKESCFYQFCYFHGWSYRSDSCVQGNQGQSYGSGISDLPLTSLFGKRERKHHSFFSPSFRKAMEQKGKQNELVYGVSLCMYPVIFQPRNTDDRKTVNVFIFEWENIGKLNDFPSSLQILNVVLPFSDSPALRFAFCTLCRARFPNKPVYEYHLLCFLSI